MKKVFLGLIVFISVLGIFFWQKNKDSTPKVEIGEEIEDKGRNHVTDIYGVVYSSNPPTSGSHFPVWAKPGLYDRLISDGYFIHSMEHGYVVIWYNCEAKDNTALKWPLNTEVLAHDEPAVLSPDSKIPFMHMNFDLNSKNEAWFTPENSPAIEKELPQDFSGDSCKSLVEELKPFLETEKRVIITPRLNMDTRLSLTAWNRLLKLDSVDKEKIELFIKTYHNKGPEKTME